MLKLNFAGWFQCRLATDPDLYDHPRGLAGFTFAVGSEPNLDGIIRLQAPIAPRSFGPTVGVTVGTVTVDGLPAPQHPLLGASVELRDGAKFEGRNGLIAYTGEEPIDPFDLDITGAMVRLRRHDLLDPNDPGKRIDDVPPGVWEYRKPVRNEPVSVDEFKAFMGEENPDAYSLRRRTILETALAATNDPVLRVALEQRLSRWSHPMPVFLLDRLTYAFEMTGPTQVIMRFAGGPQDLGGVIDTESPWAIEFSLGYWDSDALCGYMQGQLVIPFVP